MAKTSNELAELIIDRLEPQWTEERDRLDRIDRWYRWNHEELKLPRASTIEHKRLADMSRTPWLGLVVTSTAQCLFVDGYRSNLDPERDDDEPSDAPHGPWRFWQANYMDNRQIAIHRATLAYGYSYLTVLPGVDFQNRPMPVMRGVSPRKMFAVYEDIAEDDWPEYVLQAKGRTSAGREFRFLDKEFVYDLLIQDAPQSPDERVVIQKHAPHGSRVCPVVRYCNELDLDGRTPGEVEPHIPLASRINKTSYDRMLVQHFNSWKVRYGTGLAMPDTDEGQHAAAMKLRVQDLLLSDNKDAKFGTLDETQLDGFIKAHEADVHTLAAVTQTPTHELTGDLVNLSAEALAAARASHTQKVYERQKALGAGHVQALRLAALLAGEESYAEDVTGRVTWQDTTIRSMAQAVDALGKIAQMLQVPVDQLWGRIPGVEKSDVEDWRRAAAKQDPLERMQNELARQATPARPVRDVPAA